MAWARPVLEELGEYGGARGHVLGIKEQDAWGWQSPEMVLAQHLEVAGGDISAGCEDKWNVTRERAEGSMC